MQNFNSLISDFVKNIKGLFIPLFLLIFLIPITLIYAQIMFIPLLLAIIVTISVIYFSWLPYYPHSLKNDELDKIPFEKVEKKIRELKRFDKQAKTNSIFKFFRFEFKIVFPIIFSCILNAFLVKEYEKINFSAIITVTYLFASWIVLRICFEILSYIKNMKQIVTYICLNYIKGKKSGCQVKYL